MILCTWGVQLSDRGVFFPSPTKPLSHKVQPLLWDTSAPSPTSALRHSIPPAQQHCKHQHMLLHLMYLLFLSTLHTACEGACLLGVVLSVVPTLQLLLLLLLLLSQVPPCDLTVAPQTIGSGQLVLGLPKNSTLTAPLDAALLELNEAGYLAGGSCARCGGLSLHPEVFMLLSF